MKSSEFRRLFLRGIMTVVFGFGLLGNVANIHAAKNTPGVSEAVFNAMKKAQEYSEDKKYEKAREVLAKALEGRLNNYEQAQLYNVLGRLYFQEDNYEAAYSNIQRVIGFTDIPEGLMQLSLTTLAQLALMKEDYTAALDYLKRVEIMQDKPDAKIYALIAQVHLNMENYQAALQPLLKGINIERDVGRTIDENWLLMLNSVYHSLARYTDMIPVLEELIALYPKQKYVINLAAVYGQLGDERKQLLLLEPLHEQGKINSETVLVNLSSLYVLQGVPYKSARLLSGAIDSGLIKPSKLHYEMLAQSWQLSHDIDKAIEPLQKASDLTDDGKVNVRLAQIHMYLYDWGNAEAELRVAVRKGGLDDEGNALLLLGMAQFNQKKYETALASLAKAAAFEKTEGLAKQWLSYVAGEQQKHTLTPVH